MGYARLSEGRVEKVSMTEELDRAVAEVFPPASGFEIKVQRDYAIGLPSLVMQRGHLNTILVNLLQNAREALHGRGNISITARPADNYSIEVILQDDGPGIPAEQSERIFEAYYTTKEKGTGLGLSIVKHNVDLYGGQVRMESELGKGARFVLLFPARALNNDVKNA
jgi:signal transduction histidine kinase